MSIQIQKPSGNTQYSTKSSGLSQKGGNIIQIYRVRVDDLKNKISQSNVERNIYLNIKFEDSEEKLIQTSCIDIINANKFFEIRTKTNITKIEVLDYEEMKKLSKISLKGIQKEFKYTHVEEKNQIEVLIERIHADLDNLPKKLKRAESILIQNLQEQKEDDSTDGSSSDVSC